MSRMKGKMMGVMMKMMTLTSWTMSLVGDACWNSLHLSWWDDFGGTYIITLAELSLVHQGSLQHRHSLFLLLQQRLMTAHCEGRCSYSSSLTESPRTSWLQMMWTPLVGQGLRRAPQKMGSQMGSQMRT
jgi:hypothetical protein